MRALPLSLGLLVLASAWLGPLQSLLRHSFSAHMTVHMAVVAVAAPLLAIGVAGSSADPVRRAPWLFPPIPASVLELLVVWAWHTPALHHSARNTTSGLLLEQGSFLLSALYVWLSAFGGDARTRETRAGAGVVALLLTSMHMTLLGALLALPPRPLYHHASHHHGTRTSSLDDQHLGGAIMLVAGAASYLAGGLWLTLSLLRRRRGATGGTMKRKVWLVRGAKLGVVAGLLALAGFFVMASGIVPIKASSGHWSVTAGVLDFAKRRSVATHTLGATLPNLNDRALVLRGAGHYEGGCRPCHGSPELQQPRIARAMTPAPPYLAPRIARWDATELFYIVKHGIKFTGMPAWPSQQRDDEVHAVVAFMLELPKLDAPGYRRLVFGEQPAERSSIPLAELPSSAEIPFAVERSCARCHGRDGQGRGLGAFPKLAGQTHDYLGRALRAYTQDQRHSGIMQPVAAGLSESEVEELARYYARLPRSRPESGIDTALARRGERIANDGVPGLGVPACKECHGPSRHPRNPAYPNLAGQYASYLEQQLQLLKRQQRGGSPYVHIMQRVAARLSDRQISEAAAYYASLASE